MIFHIDEGMSWESVRDLSHMKSILLVIRNIAQQSNTPDNVLEWIKMIWEDLEETLIEIQKGKIK